MIMPTRYNQPSLAMVLAEASETKLEDVAIVSAMLLTYSSNIGIAAATSAKSATASIPGTLQK